MQASDHLQRSLTPTLLWGLGVGYVISGMYFGWNLGLPEGGTVGMLIATLIVIVMYVCFTLCYAELACSIPKAGGIYDYAERALGKNWGFVAGIAQVIEFVLAPPAIAAGIGSHITIFFPFITPLQGAIGAYLIFTTLNIIGVKLAATFELIITILAVVGLLIFAGIAYPHISISNLSINALPNGYMGIWAAIPFAIWFFLGIEGLANAAEESINPQRDLTRGFGSAMATLVVLCGITFIGAVGIAGWQKIVYAPNGTVSDSPLPLAVANLIADSSPIYNLIVLCGLFGMIASFHGLLMAAGRATYEMGKAKNLPPLLGTINHRFKTPTNSLVFNMSIGLIALFTGSTADIIVLAVMGALTLYMMGAVCVLKLRQKEPHLSRPFATPAFPILPYIALFLSIVAFLAVGLSNRVLFLYYIGILILAFVGYKATVKTA